MAYELKVSSGVIVIPEPFQIPLRELVVGRDSRWAKLRDRLVLAHPFCLLCEGKENLEGHHIVPYHIKPELELVESNVIILCRRDHFILGHKCNWSDWNEHVLEDIASVKETWATLLTKLNLGV